MAQAQEVYSFRPGARVTGVSAADAGAELARLRQSGPLTPRVVVDEARDAANPLHPAFEWDDAKAADEHRLQQARGIIRAVYVKTVSDEAPRPVFVHVTTEDGGSYERLSVVAATPDLYATAVDELRGKLVAAQQSLRELEIAAARCGRPVPEAVSRHLKAAIGAVPSVA